ncbi:MAG: DNA repair protein RecO [Flavobacteriales bacterium]|nr:DNA repair protein RecO [Flavobacteriales bacterium]
MGKQTLEGIVLQKIDYSESSLIIKLLCQEEGVKSFIFQGAKRKNKKGNLIQPLAILSVEYYQRKDSDLAKISALESSVVFRNIPYDPYKSSILFFMNEVLSKTIKEQEDNSALFLFLKSILQILDESNEIANFPIKFLYELTKYLGFYPEVSDNPKYFDLQEGSFVKYLPNHPFYLNEEKSALLLQLSGTKFDGINGPKIELQQRRQLIYDLLNYYKIIFDNFKDVQSLAILEATLHD